MYDMYCMCLTKSFVDHGRAGVIVHATVGVSRKQPSQKKRFSVCQVCPVPNELSGFPMFRRHYYSGGGPFVSPGWGFQYFGTAVIAQRLRCARTRNVRLTNSLVVHCRPGVNTVHVRNMYVSQTHLSTIEDQAL